MKPKYGRIIQIVAIVLVTTVVVWLGINKSDDNKQQNVQNTPTVQDTIAQEWEDVGENAQSETVESQVIDPDAPVEFQILVGNFELICEGALPEAVRYKTRDNADITCDVEFYAVVEDKEIPVFSMNLQDNRGDITMECTDENGNSMSIAFSMYKVPENLEENEVYTFYTAQDFVNTLTNALRAKTIYNLPEDAQNQEQTYMVGGLEISFGDINFKGVQIQEKEQELVFSVLLSEPVELFRLHIYSDEGDIVKYLPDSAANLIPVAFKMMPMPENLDADDVAAFYKAQELVNDVMQKICILS